MIEPVVSDLDDPYLFTVPSDTSHIDKQHKTKTNTEAMQNRKQNTT